MDKNIKPDKKPEPEIVQIPPTKKPEPEPAGVPAGTVIVDMVKPV